VSLGSAWLPAGYADEDGGGAYTDDEDEEEGEGAHGRRGGGAEGSVRIVTREGMERGELRAALRASLADHNAAAQGLGQGEGEAEEGANGRSGRSSVHAASIASSSASAAAAAAMRGPGALSRAEVSAVLLEARDEALLRRLRGAEGDGGITKHDADLCGRRLRRQLEHRLPPGVSFGDAPPDLVLTQRAVGDLQRHAKKQTVKGQGARGRVEASERAVQSSVMDRRTRALLFKLQASGRLSRVGATALRVGKEAHVYLGLGWDMALHRLLAEDEALGRAEERNRASLRHAARREARGAEGGRGPGRRGKPDGEDADEDGENDEEDDEEEEDEGDEEEEAALGPLQTNRVAVWPDESETQLHAVVLKIFKTTLSSFANRREYVEGDRRWHKTAGRVRASKPAEALRIWTEKEFTNLIRVHRVGIPSPAPLLRRGHVLAMTFLGEDGWPAPQLREVSFDVPVDTAQAPALPPAAAAVPHASAVPESAEAKAARRAAAAEAEAAAAAVHDRWVEEQRSAAAAKAQSAWLDLYVQTAVMMWSLFHLCRLVHADLSEYNLLLHRRVVHAIDLGQSVDRSHPRAQEFLRMDADNITRFFARKEGMPVLDPAALAAMVQDPALCPNLADVLSGMATAVDAGAEDEDEGPTEFEQVAGPVAEAFRREIDKL
jgi:serine/threonine-protein kinase RIO1